MQLAGWLSSFSLSRFLTGTRALFLGMGGYLYQLANKKMSQIMPRGQSDWDNPPIEIPSDNLKLCQTDSCSKLGKLPSENMTPFYTNRTLYIETQRPSFLNSNQSSCAGIVLQVNSFWIKWPNTSTLRFFHSCSNIIIVSPIIESK